MNIAVILLAAGSSRRLGQSKQLLKIKDISLLEQTTRTALLADASTVLVVLGSNAIGHRKVIENLPVKIIQNPDWRNGMGSSLKAGLNDLLQTSPAPDAAIIMVCDQPLLDVKHLLKLVAIFKDKGSEIVASRYANTLGVPVLFSKNTFETLVHIDDAHGAKKIIQQHQGTIEAIDFEAGSVDLDTPEDFKNFIRRHPQQ
jgi:molybdenum cofactor cytidylyltransferase